MTRHEVMAQGPQGGMFAVIPAIVMRDKALPMSAKMLYGIITWRCNENCYCWASNRALAEDLGISAKRVSALVSCLEDAGHIEVEVVRDAETNEVRQRRIYPVMQSAKGRLAPIPESEGSSPYDPDLYGGPLPSNSGGGTPQNEEENNKYNNKYITPPIPPKGDACAPKSKKRVKQVPDWKPERFESFWSSYPRGEDKQAAIREWDKLKPDDALLREMALGLARDLQSEAWQRGIGIPYACRWLSHRRWEDETRDERREVSGAVVDDGPGTYRL